MLVIKSKNPFLIKNACKVLCNQKFKMKYNLKNLFRCTNALYRTFKIQNGEFQCSQKPFDPKQHEMKMYHFVTEKLYLTSDKYKFNILVYGNVLAMV